MSVASPASAASDREIVVSRTIAGPRRLVYEAYTEVRHLEQWWGPNAFTTTTRSFEFREGGVWDFIMHGSDGTDYPNWIQWRELVPPERKTALLETYWTIPVRQLETSVVLADPPFEEPEDPRAACGRSAGRA